jgi:hypothetical protein
VFCEDAEALQEVDELGLNAPTDIKHPCQDMGLQVLKYTESCNCQLSVSRGNVSLQTEGSGIQRCPTWRKPLARSEGRSQGKTLQTLTAAMMTWASLSATGAALATSYARALTAGGHLLRKMP